MVTLGEKIKNRRKELNMSVDELAKHLGKNRATVYRYEKGDIENIPVDILEPLAKALNTTPQKLIGWKSAIKENDLVSKPDDDITIGDAIKAARIDVDMSLEEFSSEIGITEDELRNYESGNKQPSTGVIRVIAEKQGVDIYNMMERYVLSNDRLSIPEFTDKYIKRARAWYNEFGRTGLTDEELSLMYQYARFIIWSRDNAPKGGDK